MAMVKYQRQRLVTVASQTRSFSASWDGFWPSNFDNPAQPGQRRAEGFEGLDSASDKGNLVAASGATLSVSKPGGESPVSSTFAGYAARRAGLPRYAGSRHAQRPSVRLSENQIRPAPFRSQEDRLCCFYRRHLWGV
jgi:hypothetical protein